jgi:hypothetical protein
MKICLLTDQELDADPFPEDDWPCDPRQFLQEADWQLETLWKEEAVQQILRASRRSVFRSPEPRRSSSSLPGRR